MYTPGGVEKGCMAVIERTRLLANEAKGCTAPNLLLSDNGSRSPRSETQSALVR